MISYYNMYGRLGNMILSIYTVYYYCMQKNISENEIFFDRDMGFIPKNWRSEYWKKNFPFFKNIEDRFIPHKKYIELIKDINIKPFNLQLNDLNVVFSKCWKYPNSSNKEECLLYKKLFFNADLNRNIIKNLDFTDSLAVHVRRTDFLKFQNGKFIQTADQIKNKIFSRKIYSKYYIFSDDIKWCMENININNSIFVEYIYPNLKDYEYLILMSNCTDILKSPYSSYSSCAINLNKCMKI